MLNTPAEFPAAGAVAFLAPGGEQVRIQRRNADGTYLISTPALGASGSTTVTRDKLHATMVGAVEHGLKGHGRKRTVHA